MLILSYDVVEGDLLIAIMDQNFAELYDQHVAEVYKFIYFKVLHKETAEDLTSTTFLKALESFSKFDGKKAKFKTWVFRIARNTVIDHYRTAKQVSNIEDAWGLSNDEDVVQDLKIAEKYQKVRDYMEMLTAEQREIVLLRVWQGYKFQEIAEIVDKSEGACKVMFKRVIDKMQADFAQLVVLLMLIN